MAIVNPLRLVIDNYPEDKDEELEAVNNPENETEGKRKIPFSRVLYIEQDDFLENPPKKYFRLAPGKEVRLKHAYYVTCTNVVKNEKGDIIEIQCTYDPETRGGWSNDGRKIKGTLQWVTEKDALNAEVRLYDNLFTVPNPDVTDFMSFINPDSLTIIKNAKVEPSLRDARAGEQFQFLRLGYFCADLKDSTKENLVFNRTVSLKDSWEKIQKKAD